jgi:NADPH:quinone reductase
VNAIVVREFGPPEVLRLEPWAGATPGVGQVEIAISYAGVNFTDTEGRRGLSKAVALPWIPGIEAAGTVTAVGADVSPSYRGARVAVAAPHTEQDGTYATKVLAPVSRVYQVPAALSLETAAALPVQGLTAYHLVHTMGAVERGQTVLVHAAAGGVGHLAVQLARHAGARVLGTTSQAAKVATIAAAGAEPFVLDPAMLWVESIRSATQGRGVDLVLDGVGARTQAGGISLLAPWGHFVHFGEASGPAASIAPEALYERSLRVSAYWLWAPHGIATMSQAAETLFALAAAGTIRVHIDAIFPLAEAAEAHRRLEARATVGKLLLRAA